MGLNSKEEEFVFDTSALISLGIIMVFEKIIKFVKIVVTPSVINELEEFAQFDDKFGRAGKEVLKHKTAFIVMKANIKENIKFIEKTDNELYNLAKEKSLTLITDDIKFSRHVDAKVETQFSTYFLTALVFSGNLSKKEALELLEMLRDARNWRNNIIYLVTKKELEKL